MLNVVVNCGKKLVITLNVSVARGQGGFNILDVVFATSVDLVSILPTFYEHAHICVNILVPKNV